MVNIDKKIGKVGRKKSDWLGFIEGGIGKEVAWDFFLSFNNKHRITMNRYPKAKRMYKKAMNIGYSRENIRTYYDLWDAESFFYYSMVRFKTEGEKKHRQSGAGYVMNLNPVFKYCERKGIEIIPKERNYLNWIFSDLSLRIFIRETFKDDNVIEAILKFYVRFFIFSYALKDEYKSKDLIEKEKDWDSIYNYLTLKSPKYKTRIYHSRPLNLNNTSRVNKLCIERMKDDFNILLDIEEEIEKLKKKGKKIKGKKEKKIILSKIKYLDKIKVQRIKESNMRVHFLDRISYVKHHQDETKKYRLAELDKKILASLDLTTI
jgi:hypothetical protein